MARYFTTGTFIVPTAVVLCGAIEGPFDVGFGVNPAQAVVAPTLLVTNTSATFITLQGAGAGVTDLLFHYPNQAAASASAPNVYPYTIQVTSPGTKVVRCLVTNAYNFLDIESGRVLAQDLYIGAFNIGINIDHAYDHVTLRNLLHQVYWDLVQVQNPSWPQPIDTWVQSHAIALVVNRVERPGGARFQCVCPFRRDASDRFARHISKSSLRLWNWKRHRPRFYGEWHHCYRVQLARL